MGYLAKTAMAAIVSLGLATGASASTLTNSGSFAGVFYDFGYANPQENSVHTVGQAFRVPVPGENILVDFSFTIGPPNELPTPTGPLFVNAAIFEWDAGNNAVGNFIWNNGTDIEVDLASIGNGNNQELTFAVGTTLDPLVEYIIILTVGGNDYNADTIGNLGLAVVEDPSNALPGDGKFFIGDLALNGEWFGGNGIDLLHTANFAGERAPVGVPAPGALAIFGLSLAGLGLTLRRKA